MSYNTKSEGIDALRLSHGRPWRCSGDMYAGVPTRAASPSRVSSCGAFASPKSRTLTPVSVSMMLPGFEIAMHDALECAAIRASAIWPP